MSNQEYILITGASSDIGKHITVKLSEQYNLVLNGRNGETLSKVIDQCSPAKHQLSWVYDLKKIESIEAVIKYFIEANKINIKAFVHCASLLKILPLKSFTYQNLEETMNVNVNAAALLIKSLINKKINNSSLRNVVFISSTASIMGVKALNIYSASKSAADALMRSLAVELAPQVRLNSVLPGALKTKTTENLFNDQDIQDRLTVNSPLGLGESNDIYEMVNFLLSEKSKWITGQQFVVDGGRSINISA